MGLITACGVHVEGLMGEYTGPAKHLSGLSFANGLQEASIFLAHFTRLLKRAGPLLIKAPKVVLNVPNIEFKVAPNNVSVISGRMGIVWNIRSRGRQTGFGGSTSDHKYLQKYNLCTNCTNQPESAYTPCRLD